MEQKPAFRLVKSVHAQAETTQSIVLRGCDHLEFLQVGGGRFKRLFTLRARKKQLEVFIRRAGFSCFNPHITHYSDSPTDGYTFQVLLRQSAIAIHTYPEYGVLTASIVTCSGEDGGGGAAKLLKVLLRNHCGAEKAELTMQGIVQLVT